MKQRSASVDRVNPRIKIYVAANFLLGRNHAIGTIRFPFGLDRGNYMYSAGS